MEANIRFLDGREITEVVEQHHDNLYIVKWADGAVTKQFHIETDYAIIDLVLGSFYCNQNNELSTINDFSKEYVFGHLLNLTV
ncbi:hypothetical protein J542_1233 [Acinetobacter baumannii 299505]|uniref:hypothetical protein n=1 Tax=Acinetobacter baumannii TaxID=470 RepID=UPI00044B81AD|nr:hypothetical protein [Acinetobacter baumannii]EXB84601.1 hypothetical protein J542_1233 [Acinetobacter baumannii 299505]